MKLLNLNCPQCGAELSVNSDLNECTCNYCGTKFLVDGEVQKVQHSIENPFETAYNLERGKLQANSDFEFNAKLGEFLNNLASAKIIDIETARHYFNDYNVDKKLQKCGEVVLDKGFVMLRKDYNGFSGKRLMLKALVNKYSRYT